MWKRLTGSFRSIRTASGMAKRLTEPAKRAVFWSRIIASDRGETIVEPEHLLCGLLLDRDNAAIQVLQGLGISRFDLYSELERHRPALSSRPEKEFRLSSDSKRAIDAAFEEALRGDLDVVTTGHLLLGLIQGGVSCASRALEQCGVVWEPVYRAVVALPEPETAGARDSADEMTDRLQRALHRAELVAKAHQDDVVRTEHLLASLLQDEECIGSQILHRLGVDRKTLITDGGLYSPTPTGQSEEQIRWDWQARWVAHLTSDEAHLQGHHLETTGHLLLALIRLSASTTSTQLVTMGADLECARSAVAELHADEPLPDEEKVGWGKAAAEEGSAGSA